MLPKNLRPGPQRFSFSFLLLMSAWNPLGPGYRSHHFAICLYQWSRKPWLCKMVHLTAMLCFFYFSQLSNVAALVRNRLTLFKQPNGTRHFPARTCKDLYMSYPDLPSGMPYQLDIYILLEINLAIWKEGKTTPVHYTTWQKNDHKIKEYCSLNDHSYSAVLYVTKNSARKISHHLGLLAKRWRFVRWAF